MTQVEELEGLLATLRSHAGVAAGTLVDDRTKQESLLARVCHVEPRGQSTASCGAVTKHDFECMTLLLPIARRWPPWRAAKQN